MPVVRSSRDYKISYLLPPSCFEIEAARKVLGISQKLFADLLDVSLTQCCTWESGDEMIDGPVRLIIRDIINSPDHWKKILKTRLLKKANL